MPRKLVISQYVSLDGVIEDPVGMEGSGLGDWTGPFKRGPDGDTFKVAELFAADAVLLGRVTYEAFAPVWPHVKDETGFADRINAMPKYVPSRTLSEAEWKNTTIWRGNVAEEARRLKAAGEGDILVYGSAGLSHFLMREGLVDAINLMVFPTVLGRGKRLFADGVGLSVALDEVRAFDDGIVLMRYRCQDRPARK
jgi:dihydrofolate reductase